MILATHAIAGAALATLFPQKPAVAFVAGFISHFFLDAIPHWEYNLNLFSGDDSLRKQVKLNKKFLVDLMKTGIDFCAGILLSLFFFQPSIDHVEWTILMGALGGVSPDFLQLVYWVLPIKPLLWLQRFHVGIHSKIKLTNRPIVGIFLQVAMVVGIVLAAN